MNLHFNDADASTPEPKPGVALRENAASLNKSADGFSVRPSDAAWICSNVDFNHPTFDCVHVRRVKKGKNAIKEEKLLRGAQQNKRDFYPQATGRRTFVVVF